MWLASEECGIESSGKGGQKSHVTDEAPGRPDESTGFRGTNLGRPLRTKGAGGGREMGFKASPNGAALLGEKVQKTRKREGALVGDSAPQLSCDRITVSNFYPLL